MKKVLIKTALILYRVVEKVADLWIEESKEVYLNFQMFLINACIAIGFFVPAIIARHIMKNMIAYQGLIMIFFGFFCAAAFFFCRGFYFCGKPPEEECQC